MHRCITGGADATITEGIMTGFCIMRIVASAFNHSPESASRPFTRNRDGFVLGEGAWMFVVERGSTAKARGAKIYAEVIGYGLSGDAYHVTAPHPEGSGAFRSCSRPSNAANASVSAALVAVAWLASRSSAAWATKASAVSNLYR